MQQNLLNPSHRVHFDGKYFVLKLLSVSIFAAFTSSGYLRPCAFRTTLSISMCVLCVGVGVRGCGVCVCARACACVWCVCARVCVCVWCVCVCGVCVCVWGGVKQFVRP